MVLGVMSCSRQVAARDDICTTPLVTTTNIIPLLLHRGVIHIR